MVLWCSRLSALEKRLPILDLPFVMEGEGDVERGRKGGFGSLCFDAFPASVFFRRISWAVAIGIC